MRLTTSLVFVSATILSFAQTIVAEDEFWWSYPANYSNPAAAYDPLFEVCSNKSCSDCSSTGKPGEACWAQQYTNICYEPQAGETCCQDQYGTACVDGWFCAYDTSNYGYCCENTTSVEDCGKTLNVTDLAKTKAADVVTVTATQAFSATASATGTGNRVVSRPSKTPIPGSSSSKSKSGMSTAAIVGISLGSVAIVGFIAAAVFFFIARKNSNKYNQIGGGAQPVQNFPPAIPGSYNPQTPVAGYAAPGVGAYEPMRGAEPGHYPQDYKQPYMAAGTATMPMYHDAAPGAPPQHGVELAEMPANSAPIHEPPPAELPNQPSSPR